MSNVNVTFESTAATPAMIYPELPAVPGAAAVRAAWSRIDAHVDTATLVFAGIGGWGIAFYLLWLLGKTFDWQ